jgi:hypothetical protein
MPTGVGEPGREERAGGIEGDRPAGGALTGAAERELTGEELRAADVADGVTAGRARENGPAAGQRIEVGRARLAASGKTGGVGPQVVG